MKVSIIGTNGLPSKYGGFETLAKYLNIHLGENHDITVYCSKTPKKDRLINYMGAKLIYFPFKANGWQSLFYDFFTIIHALIKSDSLIILGFSGAFAFPLNKIFKKNIIFNIGGIEWKKVRGAHFSSILEIYLKKIMERLCVDNSNFIVIDNFYFDKYINDKYNKKPILAEYGGDHAIFEKIEDKDLQNYSFLNEDYDLSISRAQPDMNIHLLIESYKKIKNRNLVIISNWNISSYGIDLYKRNIDTYPNIFLINAIYDVKTLNKIRSNANIYLHSHSLCGTAPSLVEAMFLSLPVISFDMPTNRNTTENSAIYFKDSDELSKILLNINNNTIFNLGVKMKEISHKRYLWKRIANIYNRLLVKKN